MLNCCCCPAVDMVRGSKNAQVQCAVRLDFPPFVQDATSERGLLSVMYAAEAAGNDGRPQSAWQVQDSEGHWQGIQLGSTRVAVTLGHAMQHACAGLVQPGWHRVIGFPYGPCSSPGQENQRMGVPASVAMIGRRQLCYELRPRPAAVLDLRAALDAAGHTLGPRWSWQTQALEALLNSQSRAAAQAATGQCACNNCCQTTRDTPMHVVCSVHPCCCAVVVPVQVLARAHERPGGAV
jgi:hypothetical protein